MVTETPCKTKIDGELLYDTLLTTLAPHISKAMEDYHKNVSTYATYSMNYGLYDIQILDIKREHECFKNSRTFLCKFYTKLST